MPCHRRFFLYVAALMEVCAGGGQTASAVTLDIRVNASTDDATQYPGSNMRLTDSAMKFENQSWMGLRFNNVTIPDNAYITEAYMTFRSSSSASVTTSPTIYGQNVDTATTFTSSSNNISSRARTTASVSWTIPTWSSTQNYNTPSIKAIIQQVVNRTAWSSGNSIAILINTLTNGADRTTYSYNGNSTQAPLLHVEYIVIASPVATRLLFVVGNSGSLTAQETARRTMFQAFGYTVSLISANATQTTFDNSAQVNDLAYISEEITAAYLYTKLKEKSLGIVNEKFDLADDFAVASDYANPAGSAVTIASNSHYITSPYPLGSLTITSSSQPLSRYSGTLAKEIGTLGSIDSDSALCVVEMNGKLNNGTSAAGRRVQMPWGGSSFDFNTLSPEGIQLLSRALAWAGGVVGYWRLDETLGTSASDSSVNVKHGTLSNMQFNTSALPKAKVNGGLIFDGLNDYVSASNSLVFNLTRALSISAWVKGDAWGSGSNVDVVLRKGESNQTKWRLAIENGYVALGLDGNNNARGFTSLQTNKWYHVVGTWDGVNSRIYVNGVLDNTPTARAAPIAINTRPVYLGGQSGSDLFQGVLDDIRLFNHELSVDEISALKGQGRTTGVRIIKWVEVR